MAYKQEFENELTFENFSRIKYISPTILFISLILIVFDIWGEHGMFLMYDLLFLTLGIAMFGTYIFMYPQTARDIKTIHHTAIFIFSFVASLWAAQVSMEGHKLGLGGYETFIFTSLALVIVFNLPLLEYIFIYTISLSLFLYQHIAMGGELVEFLNTHLALFTLPLAIWVVGKLSHSYRVKEFISKKASHSANNMLRNEIEGHLETELRLKKMTAQLEKTVLERTLKLENTNQELQQEIQERKSIEKDLRNRKRELFTNNQKLQKLNDELDMFVYRTSHDMRSPLTSLMGLIDIAENEEDIKVLKSYLSMMDGTVHKLDNYIKEILNYSKNSRLRIRKNLVNFQVLLEEVLEALKDRYDHYERLNIDLDLHCPEPFHSDNKRLFIIFYSILSNSMKFYRPQESDPFIKVFIKTVQGKAHIVIRDNSQGIVEDQLPKIFEMFYRGTENSNGAGLGLYIVKEALTKICGSISVESKINRGTSVSITLPSLNSAASLPVNDETALPLKINSYG